MSARLPGAEGSTLRSIYFHPERSKCGSGLQGGAVIRPSGTSVRIIERVGARILVETTPPAPRTEFAWLDDDCLEVAGNPNLHSFAGAKTAVARVPADYVAPAVATKVAAHTPWGPSQHHEVIAPGLVSHSTASHGGFHLTGAAYATLLTTLPGIDQQLAYSYFSPDEAWLEEDCDCYAAILALSEHFDGRAVWHAVRWAATRVAVPAAAEVKARRWIDEHGGEWEVGSCGTSGEGWRASFVRAIDGARRQGPWPDYPDSSRTYTTEELEAAGVREVQS